MGALKAATPTLLPAWKRLGDRHRPIGDRSFHPRICHRLASRSLHPVGEIRTVSEGQDHVLIAAFVDGLCNTVLVQAFRSDVCRPSLYVVYREGGMTFDVIVALEPALAPGKRARSPSDCRSPSRTCLRAPYPAGKSKRATIVLCVCILSTTTTMRLIRWPPCSR